MSKEDKIEKLIAELLELEPELRGREKELKAVLEGLVNLDEYVKIDPVFRSRLKKQLLEKFKTKESPVFGGGIFSTLLESFTMKKINIAISAVVLVALGATASGLYVGSRTSSQSISGVSVFNKEMAISAQGKNAFGSLNSANSNLGGRGAGGNANIGNVVAPQSANFAAESLTVAADNSAKVAVDRPASRPQSGGGGTADAKIGILPYTPFKYVYKGESLVIDQTEGEVFKRVKDLNAGGSIANLLRSVSFGLLDMGKFRNTRAQSFTLVEDRENGYMVTVNPEEGNVYINQNWQRWNNPMSLCRDQACFDRNKLKESDVPSDSELISISNQFLKEYGINSSVYGQPQILKYWQDPVALSSGQEIYIPDMVNVVYPLKLKNQIVLDEGGNASGLNVSVDIRQKRVSAVSDLSSQDYQSSNYALETDSTRLVKFATGEIFPAPQERSATPSSEVYLGTPTQELVRTWTYNDNQNQELFVPALVFPVTGSSSKDATYHPKFIVVPLVKEILDQRSQTNPGYPMPMMEIAPAASSLMK